MKRLTIKYYLISSLYFMITCDILEVDERGFNIYYSKEQLKDLNLVRFS